MIRCVERQGKIHREGDNRTGPLTEENLERRTHSRCRKEPTQRIALKAGGFLGMGVGILIHFVVFKIGSSESWWKMRPEQSGKRPKPPLKRF